jgi:hypothetical protein
MKRNWYFIRGVPEAQQLSPRGQLSPVPWLRRAGHGYWLRRVCAVLGQGPKGVAELLPFADVP